MLEKNIGYTFKNKGLLENALTHKSFLLREKGLKNNERLEFLGDSVLGFAVAQYLYKNYPSLPEGELTKIRSTVVCEKSLFELALRIELGKYIRIGKGEEATGGRERPSILSDAVEAVFAAVYLDSGINEVVELITGLLEDDIKKAVNDHDSKDYKTLFQELVQKDGKKTPEYEIINETGPDHAKVFTAVVKLDGEIAGEGTGKTKKEAEKQAAKNALNM